MDNKFPTKDIISTKPGLGISSPPSSAIKAKIKKRKLISPVLINKPFSFQRSILGSANTEDQEYDLPEILKAVEIENLFQVSLIKHSEAAFKRGWRLVGRNKETVRYINRRLSEIALVTDIPTDLLLRELFHDFFLFSNCAFHKKRDITSSSGSFIRKFGKRLEPIAGIFRFPMQTLFPVRDSFGNIQRWEQETSHTKIKRFSRENVSHLFRNRKAGQWMGTPDFISVLDDIKALRRMEELIEILLSRSVFPLYHVKVGTDTSPADVFEDGTTEVQQIRAVIQSMPPESGFYISDERQEVTAISGRGADVDWNPILKYFKDRVLAGLNVSNIDIGIGETANRGTATQLSKNLVNHVKDLQLQFSRQFTHCLLNDLLLEGGFDVTSDNAVLLSFEEVDLEELIAIENHQMSTYQGHLKTRPEARAEINREPIPSSEEKNLFLNLQQIPLEQAKAAAMGKIQIQTAQIAAKSAENKMKLKQTTNTGIGSAASTKNRNQPTNQSGTRSAPAIRTAKNDTFTDELTQKEFSPDNRTFTAITELNKVWNDIKQDAIDLTKTDNLNKKNLDLLFSLSTKLLTDTLKPFIIKAIDEGQLKLFEQTRQIKKPNFKVSLTFINKELTKVFKGILDNIPTKLIKFIGEKNSAEAIAAAFDTLHFRIKFIARTELHVAKNFGFLKAAEAMNIETVFWKKRLECKDCMFSNVSINVKDATLKDIQCPHPNCTDELTLSDPRTITNKGI